MSAVRAVWRYEVPVDDQAHVLALSGAVLHVDCRDPAVVTLWALHSGGPEVERAFRVFGTGHPIPEGWRHVGTALSPCLSPFGARGAVVWHLHERQPGWQVGDA